MSLLTRKRFVLASTASVCAVSLLIFISTLGSAQAAPVTKCGKERWLVKTMNDTTAGSVALRPLKTTTIPALRALTPPFTLPTTTRVAPVETTRWRVRAQLIEFKLEGDSDIHLVIADPTSAVTMISEFPASSCVGAKAPALAVKLMKNARAALIKACGTPSKSRWTPLGGIATLNGVGFFDFKHGQTGVAPNAIELHPVLGFSAGKCRSSTPPPPPAPPPPPPPPPPPAPPPPPPPPPPASCAPSYPDVCIPPPPPDLNCKDIPYRNFRVIYNVPDPDPHHFDGDHDGIGCET